MLAINRCLYRNDICFLLILFFFNQTLRSTIFTFAGMRSSSVLLKGSSEEKYDLDIYCHWQLILRSCYSKNLSFLVFSHGTLDTSTIL